MAPMARPPSTMALGMSFEGFFMAPAKVQMTSKPMKLKMMIDR